MLGFQHQQGFSSPVLDELERMRKQPKTAEGGDRGKIPPDGEVALMEPTQRPERRAA